MMEVYLCRQDVHEKLNEILNRKLSQPFEILKTENGKPYIEGNPLYFSLSHSGNCGVIAIADRPVGADIEIFADRLRISVIERFSEREQAEIADERDFLKHWTAREAYIKLYGYTIAELWRRVEFLGEKLYLDGKQLNVKIRHYNLPCGVAAVCTEE